MMETKKPVPVSVPDFIMERLDRGTLDELLDYLFDITATKKEAEDE